MRRRCLRPRAAFMRFFSTFLSTRGPRSSWPRLRTRRAWGAARGSRRRALRTTRRTCADLATTADLA
eukprot:2021002-Pyramimonas_sp.AAC.1